VCARRPEQERYRVPAPLRRGEQLRETAWSSRAAELEEAQRDTRPDSCSVVGSFGQSGCTQQLLRNWQDQRRRVEYMAALERAVTRLPLTSPEGSVSAVHQCIRDLRTLKKDSGRRSAGKLPTVTLLNAGCIEHFLGFVGLRIGCHALEGCKQ